MSESSKLPGLSNLKEAELRDLYVKELGTEVPAELTTVESLKKAITAHRSTVAPAAPTTALDALTAGSTAAAGNPNDSDVKRDTGPSANAAGPVGAGEPLAGLASGHVRITHEATGLEQDMPEATWKVLGATGQKGFKKHVAKPAELD